jgi:6-phosphogluconolactonase (cycloisomerase 2 family)
LYVANNRDNSISAYLIDSNSGALTAVSGSPFAAGTNPVGTAVDPTGRFLYVANNGSHNHGAGPLAGANVSAYTINASTGALTAVSGSPFAGPRPWGIAVDPTGRFLYVTNDATDNVSAYTISPGTGALTAVSGSPFAEGAGWGIAIATVTGP